MKYSIEIEIPDETIQYYLEIIESGLENMKIRISDLVKDIIEEQTGWDILKINYILEEDKNIEKYPAAISNQREQSSKSKTT